MTSSTTENLTEKMYLVNDEQRDGLDIVAGLPAATDAVPLLWRRHDDVRPADGLHVRRDVTGQLNHPGATTATLNTHLHYIQLISFTELIIYRCVNN